MPSKYHNQKTKGFDSKKEAKRYEELRLMERAGVITDLECQPEWTLLPAFTDNHGGKHRAIKYRADFSYIEKDIEIVEDVKGVRTELYKLKKKLLLAQYHDFVFMEI